MPVSFMPISFTSLKSSLLAHFRELISLFHTFIHRVLVLLAVQEELACPNHACRTAKPVQIVIDSDNLLRGIRRAGLLAIPESGVRDPDLLGHIMGHNPVVERNLGDFRIRKHISEYIRLLHIIQNVHMLFYFQKIVLLIHVDRAVGKCIIRIHDGSPLLYSIISLFLHNCIQLY